MSKTPDRSERRKHRLEIVYRAIDERTPDPAIARQHSRKQLLKLANAIETSGSTVPVLVDAELNVIAGHGRLAACRALDLAEVPTLCLDHLSPAQLRAFMIADNRLTELATWDDRLLAQQLHDLSLSGLDFSLDVTGFDMAEIDLRIASLGNLPAPDDDPIDAPLEQPADPPLSKPGDLWMLGDHRVLYGSALDAAAFAVLMGENVPRLSSAIHLTTCRSMVMRAASAQSTIALSQWRRARWTGPNSPPSSAGFAETLPHSALTARCTPSVWIGAISRSCWPPAEKPMPS